MSAVVSPSPPSSAFGSSSTASASAQAPRLTSAAGLLALLDDPEVELQQEAITQIEQVVDTFWPEIATHIPKIESLYEDESFPARDVAAIVASKVFYHLEELDESLRYALGAGARFNVNEASEYVQTIVSKGIDEYIRLRVEAYDAKDKASVTAPDDRLISIVERMLDKCMEEGEYQHTLGIAIESRRLDLVRRSIQQSGDVKSLLSYCFNLCQQTAAISSREFRVELLAVLVELYQGLEHPDYLNMCQCFQYLNQPQRVAEVMEKLVRSEDEDGLLMAYQIAFDLGENQNQPFLIKVSEALPAAERSESAAGASSAAAAAGSSSSTTSSISTASIDAPEAGDDSLSARLTNLRRILNGDLPVSLYLQFLYEQNHTDLNILRSLKDKLEQRNSVTHGATVICHALMSCGTTVDTFLRESLEWLGKAQNWAKFTATASIGVIHKGHHKESQKLLEPYLPSGSNVGGSPYQEGGALYALGLIHSNHGQAQIQYLSDALRNAGNNEIVQHGACLGLGLAAMASDSMALFETLKNVVMSESAVAGEAAGIAMGLVLLGTGNGEAIQEMLAYAHDTQHEKIIRGLSMGIALITYGREEEADVVIEQMTTDKDPIIRYGGMWSIALAYACTSNNKAIKRLLHVAVSDVDDDVRRAAVMALGFVLGNQPAQVPRVVGLLSESWNEHVRYGAAMAVGFACAGGTGPYRKDALALLEPLLKDRVEFVRQGAFIAMAMVLIQHNDVSEPKVATFRQSINDAMAAKADTMTKVGALIGAGLLDAGGRNCTLALMSPAGHKKMAAIVGMAIFPQFWYWYPLTHFISLALSPTAVIGLNRNLRIPEPFQFLSNAPPSHFAYPAPIELKKAEEKKTVKHATLSVTAKAKAKQKKKEGEASAMMDVDELAEKPTEEKKGEEEKKADEKEAEAKKKPEPEAKTAVLHNPARVTAGQFKVLSVPSDQRYKPVAEVLAGCVMLRDTAPSEPEQLKTAKAPSTALPGEAANEREPPKPFTYLGD